MVFIGGQNSRRARIHGHRIDPNHPEVESCAQLASGGKTSGLRAACKMASNGWRTLNGWPAVATRCRNQARDGMRNAQLGQKAGRRIPAARR